MIIENLEGENTVVTGFEYIGEVAEDENETKNTEIQLLIVEMLQDKSSVSRKEIFSIASAKGVSEKTIKRAIKVLVDSGEITSVKNGRETSYMQCAERALPLSEE
jgi:Fe2+ or Zn2+ uptake regulation protein